MNKLSHISENKVGVFYNVGLSKLSSEYFYNSIEYNSCSCSMLYKYLFKTITGISNLSRYNKISKLDRNSLIPTNTFHLNHNNYMGALYFPKKK